MTFKLNGVARQYVLREETKTDVIMYVLFPYVTPQHGTKFPVTEALSQTMQRHFWSDE